jgi:hypothetical protein
MNKAQEIRKTPNGPTSRTTLPSRQKQWWVLLAVTGVFVACGSSEASSGGTSASEPSARASQDLSGSLPADDGLSFHCQVVWVGRKIFENGQCVVKSDGVCQSFSSPACTPGLPSQPQPECVCGVQPPDCTLVDYVPCYPPST